MKGIRIPDFRDANGNVWIGNVLSDAQSGDGERFMAHMGGRLMTRDEVAAESGRIDQLVMAARDAEDAHLSHETET